MEGAVTRILKNYRQLLVFTFVAETIRYFADVNNRLIESLEYTLLSIAAVLSVYVVAYCAILRPGPMVWISHSQYASYGIADYQRKPNYGGIPAWIFRPLQYVDQRYVRPSFWRESKYEPWGLADLFVGRVRPFQTNIGSVAAARLAAHRVRANAQRTATSAMLTNNSSGPAVHQPDKSTFSPGAFCFKKAPLEKVLKVYAALSGRVVLRPSSLPTQLQISYENRTPLTQEEALKALEQVLAKQYIVLFPQGPKFVKALVLRDTLQD